MAEAADSKQRFRRISAAGIFFQGGAAAVDTRTIDFISRARESR